MRWALLAALLALGGCGINGAPTQPAGSTGVDVTGEARIGVVGTL